MGVLDISRVQLNHQHKVSPFETALQGSSQHTKDSLTHHSYLTQALQPSVETPGLPLFPPSYQAASSIAESNKNTPNKETLSAYDPTEIEVQMQEELLRFFSDQSADETICGFDLNMDSSDSVFSDNFSPLMCRKKSESYCSTTPGTPKNQSKSRPNTQAYSPPRSTASEESEVDSLKSIRKLKELTILIIQLICAHQPTTFKCVAVKLIDAIIIKNGPHRHKEERNARRRVYDVINVLIAAGLVLKNDKYISWKVKWQSVEIELKRREVEKKKRIIEEKKQVLKEKLDKYLAVRYVLGRNSKNPVSKPALNFPFHLMSIPDSPENTVSVISSLNATQLHLKTAVPHRVMQDVDILLELNMHKLSSESLSHVIRDKELLRTYTETKPKLTYKLIINS